MIGSWCKMTTTTASGTSAVGGLTSVSGFPTVDNLFPTNDTFCWYVILDVNDKPLEAGVGKKTSSSNINRVKVQKTYTGGTYDDTDPTALTLVNATEYHVIITAIDASISMAMPGLSTTFGTRGILSNGHVVGNNTLALTDDRQYLIPFDLAFGGVLKGFIIDANAGAANTNCQCGLYALDHNGEATKLLARTADFSTSASGLKVPACVSNIWVPPGYLYAISVCSKDGVAALAPTLRSTYTDSGTASPWGLISNTNNSVGGLYKAQAGWTDLADVDTTSGWTSQGGASAQPTVALLFE